MRRIVVKVGTHVLSEQNRLCKPRMEALCDFLVELMTSNEVILVSSAAIVAGYSKMRLDKTILSNRQALASLGQPYLIEAYNKHLSKHNKIGAQILITAEDFDSRKRTNHTKNLIEALLENGVLPIINENDATATEEIVFGDNDQLSAHTAFHFNADLLVVLSDIDGYYDKDPNKYQDATIKRVVSSIDQDELKMPQISGSEFATGGIVTKLKAADFLIKNSVDMFMCSGFDLDDAKEFTLNNSHKGGTLFTSKRR